MRSLLDYFKIAMIGGVMGIAEAIPGVSGGTIAFIFKIYEELLDTIKSIKPSLFNLLIKGKFGQFFDRINGKFILFLITGMLLGLIVGVFGVSYLLENEKEPLWAFFFGLVLASSVYLAKDIKWNVLLAGFFVVGVLVTYSITLVTPSTGSDNLMFIFFSGVVAISALMLPGLSGSFILLLLGLYAQIIGTLKDFLSATSLDKSFFTLCVFGAGCLTGLFTFARILSFTFKNYFEKTMAFLIGILIGSLNKLWPWKIATLIFDKDTGEMKTWDNSISFASDHIDVIKEINLLPAGYDQYADPKMIAVLFSFLFGMVIIAAIHFKETISNKTEA